MLVDFIIVGAQKCGTTTLAEHLSRLGGVSFCQNKEPHFFSKTPNWSDEIDNYHDLYQQSENVVYGEASTTYSFCDEYPETINRLYTYNPNLKLIYILRDPVARIESHYNHRLRNGKLSTSFIEAISTHPCFIERSQYGKQLSHILKTFPANQVKVILFEDLIKMPFNVVREVCDFIEIKSPQQADLDLSPKNVSDASLKLKHPLAKLVIKSLEKLPFSYKISRFLPIKKRASKFEKNLVWLTLSNDIEKLEQSADINLGHWKSKYEFNVENRLQ